MRLGQRIGLLIGTTLLVAGASHAASITGEFTVEGTVKLADGSIGLDSTALFLSDSQLLTSLSLTAATATLHYYELSFLMLDTPLGIGTGVETNFDHTEETLTNVVLQLAPSGDHAGILGIYPASDAALSLDLATASTIEPRLASRIGNDETQDAPNAPFYVQHASAPHLFIQAAGLATYSGTGAVKLVGPDVEITSEDGAKSVETGDQRPSTTERVITWIYLEFDAATLTIDSPEADYDVLAREASSLRTSQIEFKAADGRMRVGDAEHEATPGEVARVSGTLAGSMTPTPSGKSASLRLEGDVTETSLASVQVTSTPSGAALSWLALALVGTTIVVGTGAFVVAKRRHAPAVSAEADDAAYYSHYALFACEEGDLAGAIRWLQAARRHAPDDVDLALWEGILHHAQEEHDDAIRCGEEAAQASPPDAGLADYYLAVFYASTQTDANMQLAQVHLERALAREPGLMGEIMTDSVFDALRGRDFDAMIRDARERVAMT